MKISPTALRISHRFAVALGIGLLGFTTVPGQSQVVHGTADSGRRLSESCDGGAAGVAAFDDAVRCDAVQQ